MARTSSSRAFTLMELLVVIAIIGILMALLFPAVGAAINTAKRAQAKNDATQIATALKGYYTEYGRWPANATETAKDLDDNILSALRGGASNTTDNPRQITFLEVNNYKKGKSGISGTKFVDPWKQPYQVMIDANYDNKIPGVPDGTSTKELNGTVAVWSPGVPTKGTEADKTPFTANNKADKYAKSWE